MPFINQIHGPPTSFSFPIGCQEKYLISDGQSKVGISGYIYEDFHAIMHSKNAIFPPLSFVIRTVTDRFSETEPILENAKFCLKFRRLLNLTERLQVSHIFYAPNFIGLAQREAAKLSTRIQFFHKIIIIPGETSKDFYNAHVHLFFIYSNLG